MIKNKIDSKFKKTKNNINNRSQIDLTTAASKTLYGKAT